MKDRESMIFLDSTDFLYVFVVFIVLLLLGSVFLAGLSIGRNQEIEKFFILCDSDSSFDLEGKEGIFECKRMDR